MALTAWALGVAGMMATPAAADAPIFSSIAIGGAPGSDTITVEQENDMWTRISDDERKISIYMSIETSRGYIEFYRVGRNLTDGAVRGIFSTYTEGNTGNPIETPIDSRRSVRGSMNIFIGEHTRLNPTDEQAIVNRCNSKWTETESGHSFTYNLPLAIHADAREHRRKRFPPQYGDVYVGYGDSTRARATGFAPVQVKCLGKSKPTLDDVVEDQGLHFDHGAMKVNDIRMTLTTYSNAYSEPTPGTKCKKAKLRVTMETNQEGPLSFKLWKQRGDGAIRNETVNVTAHHEDGRFFAVHERWIAVEKTTNVQFNARDLVNETFSHETGWKDITLHCTGAGGEGFANPTGDDDDNTPDIASFEGHFQFIDNGPLADRYTCPRDAKALVWFDAPKADNIHYSLDCGSLGNFSGVLQPEKIANNHYRAGKLIKFELSDTIEAGCTLRTVSPGDPVDHAFASHTFQCAKTAGHSSDIGGLTVDQGNPGGDIPAPQPKPKVNPAVGGGVGGLVAEPNPTHAPATASDDPVRTNPTPSKPQIVCKGGKVSKGKCTCGQNKILRQIGNRAYQCLAVAKPPEKKKPVRVTPAPKKAKLVCKGGKVKRRQVPLRLERQARQARRERLRLPEEEGRAHHRQTGEEGETAGAGQPQAGETEPRMPGRQG